MPYIHLANGETKQIDNDEMKDRFGDEPPRVYVENDTEMTIIGIYPDDVKLEKKEGDKGKKEEKTEETPAYRKGVR